ncbi:MAG: (Fe-S)-binding protein [Polyangiaceae bacterium]|nr:(Fe-S)-binding protein [Polyangiaceae bacterium]
MTLSDHRSSCRLPNLEARKATLDRCVFCPKLCRSACPVSNAEPRETVTPWGKMSMAHFAANESVDLAKSFAEPAWACTGCFGCRDHCDHKNDVAGTLFEARSAFVSERVAPDAAMRTIERFAERASVLADDARRLESLAGLVEICSSHSKNVLLVGCEYARAAAAHGDDVTLDAVRATAKLVGGPISLASVCCGAPLLYAGDKKGFVAQGAAFAAAMAGKDLLVVLDPGCMTTLRIHHPAAGTTMPFRMVHFTELAASKIDMLRPAAGIEAGIEGHAPLRYHDPCQLGRGLGIYDEPRALLARALGRAPDEFARCKQEAQCSGAGGLLPVTMPAVSKAITANRLADHEAEGGGTVITACASSARSFRKQGAKVVDLVTLVARALGVR